MSDHVPPQTPDEQPGNQAETEPRPTAEMQRYRGTARLSGKVALVTGRDSGIGRAVAGGFATEGADVAIVNLNEHEDAQETMRTCSRKGQTTLPISGDAGDSAFCADVATRTAAPSSTVAIGACHERPAAGNPAIPARNAAQSAEPGHSAHPDRTAAHARPRYAAEHAARSDGGVIEGTEKIANRKTTIRSDPQTDGGSDPATFWFANPPGQLTINIREPL